MQFLITATFQVSIVLGVALGAAAMLRRRSAALRHWILTVAVACALVSPALELTMPAWSLPADTSRWATSIVAPATLAVFESIASDTGSAVSNTNRARAWMPADVPIGAVILGIWAVGAGAVLLMLLTRLMQLRQLASAAKHVDDQAWLAGLQAAARIHRIGRPIDLLHGLNPAMVVTWGFLRPRVLVPEGANRWSDARLRVVLAHELAHIRRNDWLVQMGAAVLKAVYWFNPLVWIAARSLNREAERACDDLVLEAGVTGPEYATHLLAVARDAARWRRRWSAAAAAIARPSTLEGRIRAMLNVRLNRDPLSRVSRAAAVLTIGFVALAAASLSTDASAQPGLGSISAVVYDQAGGFVPNVGVKILHVDSGRASTAATDRSGTIAIRDVPAGVYELTISLPGFATVKATVDVRPGDRLQRSVVLPLGTIEETLTVVGGGEREPVAPAPRPVREIPPPRGPTSIAGGIGGNIKVPRKVVDVKPRYPAELEGTGAAATVTLNGRIGIDGYVLDLKDVSATPPHPAFVASALEASRQWEFSPTLLNGAPVETNMTITIRYRPQ